MYFKVKKKQKTQKLKKSRPEEDLQKSIIKTYNNFLKEDLHFKSLLYSNRNENNKGGSMGLILGAIYKSMGRVAGIPDLTLLYDNAKVLFIELKHSKTCLTTKGVFTKSKGLGLEQQEIHKIIKSLGFQVEVIYSVEGFESLLKSL